MPPSRTLTPSQFDEIFHVLSTHPELAQTRVVTIDHPGTHTGVLTPNQPGERILHTSLPTEFSDFKCNIQVNYVPKHNILQSPNTVMRDVGIICDASASNAKHANELYFGVKTQMNKLEDADCKIITNSENGKNCQNPHLTIQCVRTEYAPPLYNGNALINEIKASQDILLRKMNRWSIGTRFAKLSPVTLYQIDRDPAYFNPNCDRKKGMYSD